MYNDDDSRLGRATRWDEVGSRLRTFMPTLGQEIYIAAAERSVAVMEASLETALRGPLRLIDFVEDR